MAAKKTTKKADLSDVIAEEGSETKKVDVTKTSGKPVKITDDTLINVKSNVFGKLIYVDQKTREETAWDMCGVVHPMTFGALRSMKASQSDFFKNQWIVITGFAEESPDGATPADIYKALYITNYYKDFIDPTDYSDVCSWEPEEIEAKVALMSKDARANLTVALNTYIEKGLLDSLKAIKAFEEAIGCELRMPE